MKALGVVIAVLLDLVIGEGWRITTRDDTRSASLLAGLLTVGPAWAPRSVQRMDGGGRTRPAAARRSATRRFHLSA